MPKSKLDALPGGNNTAPPAFGPGKKRDNDAGAEFVVEIGVPILDVHEDVSLEDLQQIIENNNRRAADTGDASPLIMGEGHTSDGEGSDRPVVGFADNYRLGSLGVVDPRPCILADFHIRADHYEDSKAYPRRSVELWRGDEEGPWIDAIALLGGTTPKRALGMLFSKSKSAGKSGSSKVCRYELTDDEDHMSIELSKEDLVKLVHDTVMESPVGKYVARMMEEEQAAPEPEEEESGETDEVPADDEAEKKSADEECDDEPKKEQKMSKAERTQVQKTDEQIELVRYKKQAEAQQAQIEALQQKFRRTERQGDLERLRFEGFAFELADELDYVLDMSDEQYAKHLGKIKTRYQKAPLGYAPIPTAALEQANGSTSKIERLSMAAAGNDPEARKEWLSIMRKATKHAEQHKVSFDEALAKVS